jgi:hypothetical protein
VKFQLQDGTETLGRWVVEDDLAVLVGYDDALYFSRCFTVRIPHEKQ